MLSFSIRRLLVSIPVLFLSTVLVFLLVEGTGDPLGYLKNRNPPVPQATIDLRRHQLYLDRSLPDRYWRWVSGLFHGDLGPSTRYGNNIGAELKHRIYVTLTMVLLAALLALVLAVISGVVSAVRQYSALDYSLTFTGFLFLSLPTFWFAVLLKQAAIQFNLSTGTSFFKTIGESDPIVTGGPWHHFVDFLGHYILPTVVLALISYASWSRFQRASMLEVLSSDYLRLARAKGLSSRRVLVRHALRTALIPLTTVVAIDFAALLGGAVITETVFDWHGLGTFGLQAITDSDVYPELDWLLFTAVAVIVFNLLADLLYAVLDPRIRYA